MAKGQPWSAHHLNELRLITATTLAFLELPGSLSQGSYIPSLKAFQTSLYLYVVSPYHTWHCKHLHHFSPAYDNKINNCGF